MAFRPAAPGQAGTSGSWRGWWTSWSIRADTVVRSEFTGTGEAGER
jgi:hypothetical protein